VSHQEGAYLGGIRSVEDLRLRCRIDSDTGCWHWSLSITQGSPKVHFVLDGMRMAARGRRAAVLLSGRPIPKDHIAFAAKHCKSDDCVNPEHAVCSNVANHRTRLKILGLCKSPAKTAAALRTARTKLSKLSLEKAREIRASDETYVALGKRYGVAPSCIGSVKRGEAWKETMSAASVFTWRALEAA